MNLKKDSPIVYAFYAILGAILLTTMYYFSLQNKYKICALIPALPVVGIVGLLFIFKNKGNSKEYIINHIKFLLLTVLLYVLILFTFYLTNNIVLSLISMSIIWLAILYKFLIFP